MTVEELIEKLKPFKGHEVIIYDMTADLPEDQIQLFLDKIEKDQWTDATVYILLKQ